MFESRLLRTGRSRLDEHVADTDSSRVGLFSNARNTGRTER
jgi:hypothetical protein